MPRSTILPDTAGQFRLFLLSLRNRAEIQKAIALPAKVSAAIKIREIIGPLT
jgi:hypothetical protein